MTEKKNIHHKILIIGGGCAGITVAARLARRGFGREIALIEPSDTHYYQPLWTLVAAGIFKLSNSARPTQNLIPKNVTWYHDEATAVSASNRTVQLRGGISLTCDWMIVATGLELDWDRIPGSKKAMTAHNVCSIYDRLSVDKTRDAIHAVTQGKMIFTFPPPPVKCAGAPQKIMYLADDLLKRRGVRDQVAIEYRSALPTIFAVPVFAEVLSAVARRKKINTTFNQKLIEVRSSENIAVFADMATGLIKTEQTYDFLHIVPPMRAPQVVRESDVCATEGPAKDWVDVDQYTLRHKRFPKVFALGDVCSAPSAKTGAAIRKQAPVLVSHLIASIQGHDSNQKYDGYSSCPLVTGFGKVVLAEFGYEGKLLPTFPGNAARESRLMWWLKTLLLPRMYWHLMLRGRG